MDPFEVPHTRVFRTSREAFGHSYHNHKPPRDWARVIIIAVFSACVATLVAWARTGS